MVRPSKTRVDTLSRVMLRTALSPWSPLRTMFRGKTDYIVGYWSRKEHQERRDGGCGHAYLDASVATTAGHSLFPSHCLQFRFILFFDRKHSILCLKLLISLFKTFYNKKKTCHLICKHICQLHEFHLDGKIMVVIWIPPLRVSYFSFFF